MNYTVTAAYRIAKGIVIATFAERATAFNEMPSGENWLALTEAMYARQFLQNPGTHMTVEKVFEELTAHKAVAEIARIHQAPKAKG